MRNRVDGLSSPTYGKAADIARVFIELGLRVAAAHGLHTIYGILERNQLVQFSPETIASLYPPAAEKAGPTVDDQAAGEEARRRKQGRGAEPKMPATRRTVR